MRNEHRLVADRIQGSLRILEEDGIVVDHSITKAYVVECERIHQLDRIATALERLVDTLDHIALTGVPSK